MTPFFTIFLVVVIIGLLLLSGPLLLIGFVFSVLIDPLTLAIIATIGVLFYAWRKLQ